MQWCHSFHCSLQLKERHVRSRTFDNLRLCHLSMSWIFAHDCDHTHQTFHHMAHSCYIKSIPTETLHSLGAFSLSLLNIDGLQFEIHFQKIYFSFRGQMHIWFAFGIGSRTQEKKNSAHKKSVTIHNSLWCQKWFIYLRVDFMLVWNKSVVCAAIHVCEFAEPMKRQLFSKPNRLPRFLFFVCLGFCVRWRQINLFRNRVWCSHTLIHWSGKWICLDSVTNHSWAPLGRKWSKYQFCVESSHTTRKKITLSTHRLGVQVF